MPAPTRTTNEEILAVAVCLVEEGGPDALTMKAVAARVGVQPPSLYKRVQGREHLLGMVAERAASDVAAVLDEAQAAGEDPLDGVIAMARSLREFAHGHPRLFGLLFAALPDAARPSRDVLARASAAVLTAGGRLAGPERALDAARTITAWAYGFLTMELAGAFQLGGEPGEAFEFGAHAIAHSLEQPMDEPGKAR